jgi:hypothetical protein
MPQGIPTPHTDEQLRNRPIRVRIFPQWRKNQLYYGDNLEVLRQHIKDESVDLIYRDPPFNSRQDYNVLFAEKDGTRSSSQIMAFEDTWGAKSAARSKHKSKSHTKEGCPTLPRSVQQDGKRECPQNETNLNLSSRAE